MIRTSLLVLLGVVLTLGRPGHAAGRPPPRRVVSLVPAVTEMLFAIGAGDAVVGVSSFDRYPPEVESRRRVGALLDPDIEGILRLKPDLVVAYASQTDLERQLARATIPLFRYRHADLRDVTDTLRAVGTRIGRRSAASQLATSLERRLEAVRDKTAPLPKPRVMLVFGREPGSLRNVLASGGFGFLNDMLVSAGGANVFADVRRESVQATAELIIARRPDVIMELRAVGLAASQDTAPDPAWNALSSVPAVRDRRLIVLRGSEFVVPGPRVADAVEKMAAALHHFSH